MILSSQRGALSPASLLVTCLGVSLGSPIETLGDLLIVVQVAVQDTTVHVVLVIYLVEAIRGIWA